MTEEIRLTSGRVIRANKGILGIGPDLMLTHGYDGLIEWEEMPDPLTGSERAEIGAILAERLQRWITGGPR